MPNWGYRNGLCLAVLVTALVFIRSANATEYKLFVDSPAPAASPGVSPTDAGVRARPITINPLVADPGRLAKGDGLGLDLFDGESYVARVDRITVHRTGTVTVRARLEGSADGYLLISTTGGESLGSIRIPEQGRDYRVMKDAAAGTHRLLEPGLEAADELADIVISPPPPHKIQNNPSPPTPMSGPQEPATIDVMIVYTPAAKSWAGGVSGINNVIAQAMGTGQLVLDNSNTLITLNLVHTAEVSYTTSGSSSTDLSRLRNPSDGYMDEVHDWREAYGADLVSMFSQISDTGGIAYLLNSISGLPDYAFSIIRVQQAASTYTAVHELGHNLGCGHHKAQNTQPGPGLFGYSAGWRWTGTSGGHHCCVMSYESGSYYFDGITHSRVAYFSNPSINYAGFPTGDAADGDNARTLRETKHVVAAYRIPGTPPDAPIPMEPSDGAVNVGLTPTLMAGPFFDPDGDTHAGSQWQVDDGSDFSSPEWDSGDSEASTQATVPAGSLRYGVIHYWRARYKDNREAWSNWSPARSANPGVYADFDTDWDVDIVDFGLLQRCLTGPEVPQNDPACQAALIDGNNSVDDQDVDLFLACLSGPDIPAEQPCLRAVAAPTFNPAGGTSFAGSINVTISTATAGAEIRYTTDGTEPTRSTGAVYDGPVHLTDTTTIKAAAYAGKADSRISSATFTAIVATPTFDPPTGTGFLGSIDVTISTATAGAEIRYTTDGTQPNRSRGTVYTGPIRLNAQTTIAAIAYADNMADSQVASATFWEGVWQPLGSGTDNAVHALTIHNGELIAGGNFTAAGGTAANYIAKWDDVSWQPLGSGVGGTYAAVYALTVYNGELIAGGGFTTAGGTPVYYIARWDGSSWRSLGGGMMIANQPRVHALTVHNGELIAGGYFTRAGATTANYIAKWNGSAWQPLGSGMNNTVYSLAVYNGELIAGGNFTTAGGTTANYIAKWNGSSWQSLGSGMGGFYPLVRALTLYNGELIAAGDFNTASGTAALCIAKWNGSAWQPLGSGISSYQSVYALTVHNGELIAGGQFTTAGGKTVNRIAKWDGSAWWPLGSGMGGGSPIVHALAVYYDELVAAGTFTTAGMAPINRIARWTPDDDTVAFPRFYPLDGTTFIGSMEVRLHDATPGAEIRYTTDGSVPNRYTGTVYTGPLTLTGTTTIKAIGYVADPSYLPDSPVASATYTAVVTAPTFDPPSGTSFVGSLDVTLATATPGAAIRYTTDGTDPTPSTGTVYTQPVQLTANTTLKAIAYAENMLDSQITSATYTLVPAASPTFNPAGGGTFSGSLDVTITTTTTGAEIRYTTDGSNPTRSTGQIYTAPVHLTDTTTIRAIAWIDGMADSPASSATYTLLPVNTPYFTPSSLTSTANAVDVMIRTGTAGAEIRYTTDGSTPTRTTGTVYTAPVQVMVTTTIKAIAYMDGRADSALATGTYTMVTATPTFDQPDGIGFHDSIDVAISTATPGAEIRYTTDGTAPTRTTGAVYSGSLHLTATTTIKAIAYIDGRNDSAVASITAWEGMWQPLGSGMNSNVAALAVYDGDLIAGGAFTTADGTAANYIARWDGTSWQPFGGGMNAQVSTLLVHNSELYAGGVFTTAGGVPANCIAKWDGTSWQALGSGMNASVYALTIHNNALIAGGSFTTAGGTTVNAVAKWDGTSWLPLGSGFVNGHVLSLAVYNGYLFAGGIFYNATAGINNIARWSGSAWMSPSTYGMSDDVRALAVYNSALYAAGDFIHASAESRRRIARWTGGVWDAAGNGLGRSWAGSGDVVHCLTVHDGRLIAGGSFPLADDLPAANIAQWDGSSWQALGGGTNAQVRAVTEYDGSLIAAGFFTTAGGVPANRIAVWVPAPGGG